MRRWVISIVALLASGLLAASEQEAVSTPVAEVAPPVFAYELAPSPSLSLAPNGELKLPEIKPASKPKLVKKSQIKKTLLSRTARNQMALLVESPKTGSPLTFRVFDDEDIDFGTDDLDLHRSFSRPKVAEQVEHDDANDQDISEHAKLRLFMARMKAVEAHQAMQASQAEQARGDELSDEVRLRLFLARQQAVRAHEKKFSSS